MTVETATYISDLDTALPAATDPLAQMDDHLRLIKATIKATFPNVEGEVTSTHTELNNSGSLGTRMTAVESGKLDKTGGTLTGALTVQGNINATSGGKIQEGGNALIPQGSIILWSGSSSAIPAGWTLCNGVTVSGVTPPDLRDKFVVGAGNSYTVGQTGGSASMSGTTNSSGSHTHSGSTDAQGSHSHGGSSGSTVLTVNQIPSHTHTITHGSTSSGGASNVGGGSAGSDGAHTTTNSTGGGQGHTHSISADGSHSHTITTDSQGSHSHTFSGDNRSPFYALCYIMKL